MAKQRAEKDHMLKEAEWKKAEKLKKLAELRKKYRDLLDINHSLPEYICLKPAVHTHSHTLKPLQCHPLLELVVFICPAL